MLRKRKYEIERWLFLSKKSNLMVFILGYNKKMRIEKYALSLTIYIWFNIVVKLFVEKFSGLLRKKKANFITKTLKSNQITRLPICCFVLNNFQSKFVFLIILVNTFKIDLQRKTFSDMLYLSFFTKSWLLELKSLSMWHDGSTIR